MAGARETADIIARLNERGVRALPVAPGTKVPGGLIGLRWQKLGAWQKRVLTGADIAALARAPNGFGVCVVTGEASGGLVAVDIDLEEDEKVAAVLAALPDSRCRKKGRKGETLFFRSALGNRDYLLDRRKIVQILSTGRQTVIPPSVHPDTGAEYEWTGDYELEAADLAELPELTADHAEAIEAVVAAWRPAEERPAQKAPPARPAAEATGEARGRAWAEVKLAAAVRDMAGTPEGGRNEALNGIAYGLFRCAARGWLAESEIVAAMESAALAAGLKLPEIRATLRSARKAGLADPHDDLPERESPTIEVRIRPREVIEAGDGALADAETGEIIETGAPEPPRRAAIDDLLNVPGIVGEVADWIVATARRPNRRMALATALALVGTLIGRAASGPTGSGTHLYVLEIAPTGAGKQHQADCVARLAKAAGQPDLVGPGQFMSMSSAIRFLQGQPLAICCQDEFGAFLKRVNSRRASSHERGISEVLRSLWGLSFESYRTPEWAQVKSSTVIAPALTIVGLSTPDELFAALTGEDVSNGFLNRFLVVDGGARVAESEPRARRREVPVELARGLRRLLEFGRGEMDIGNRVRNPAYDAAPTIVGWADEAAAAIYSDLARECEARMDDGAAGAFYVRTAETAVRLATIVAAGMDGPRARIDRPTMAWAAAFARACADWTAAEAEARMTEELGAALLERRVRETLSEGGGRMSYRELHRRLFRHARHADDLRRVLAAMREAGVIEEIKMRTPGRPNILFALAA